MATAHRRDARQRPDVDDAAAPPSQHPPARLLAGAKAAEDEVAPRLLDVGQGDLLRRTENAVAGDVAKEVDAPEFAIEASEV